MVGEEGRKEVPKSRRSERLGICRQQRSTEKEEEAGENKRAEKTSGAENTFLFKKKMKGRISVGKKNCLKF